VIFIETFGQKKASKDSLLIFKKELSRHAYESPYPPEITRSIEPV
jgi:hypothetical protein